MLTSQIQIGYLEGGGGKSRKMRKRKCKGRRKRGRGGSRKGDIGWEGGEEDLDYKLHIVLATCYSYVES